MEAISNATLIARYGWHYLSPLCWAPTCPQRRATAIYRAKFKDVPDQEIDVCYYHEDWMREKGVTTGPIGDRSGPLFIPSRRHWDGYVLPSKAEQRWMAQVGVYEIHKFKLQYPIADDSRVDYQANDERTREEKERARLPKLDPRDKDYTYITIDQ